VTSLIVRNGRLLKQIWITRPIGGVTEGFIDVGPAPELPPSPTQLMIDRIKREKEEPK
jgi:hypothetical protein